MTVRNITEFDLIFLSYDEPNCERHWADLVAKAPWAKRVHGVKGFDAAHRVCAERSETDFFITVDADNTVRPEFFDLSLDLDNGLNCISWNGLNRINGLAYGNGGLKLWRRAYVLGMRTHEHADDPRRAVDFCWEQNYRQMPQTFSDVWNNASSYQAFRVGFREGVKLALNRGERVAAEMMRSVLHRVNLRNLRIWACVGAHEPHGLWAIYGARLAWSRMCDPTWDHTVVRDYDWFTTFWQAVRDYDNDKLSIISNDLGLSITQETKIVLPLLDVTESEFFRDVASG